MDSLVDSSVFTRVLGAKVDDEYYEEKYMCGGTSEKRCREAYNLANDDENQEETNSGDTIMLGIALCTFGSIALNCGNNIQALGLQGKEAQALEEAENQKVNSSSSINRVSDAAEGASEDASQSVQQNNKTKGNDEKRRTNYTHIVYFGTFVFVFGSLLTFGSFAFAPQSVLAPLEAVQFVSNVFFSKFILKQQITTKQVIGTILIILGCVAAILFHQFQLIFLGKESAGNGPYPIPFLLHLYESPVTIGYLVFVGFTTFCLHIVYAYYTAREKAGQPLRFSSVVRPMSYSMFSALFGGGIMIVQAKCIASIVLLWFGGCHQWCHGFTYIILFAWIVTVIIWLTRMEVALRLFDSSFMIPLLQVQFILFAIIGGGIYFKEFDAFLWYQWIGFWGGIALVCYGLSLLAGMGEPGKAPNELAARRSPDRGTEAELQLALKGDATRKTGKVTPQIIGARSQPSDEHGDVGLADAPRDTAAYPAEFSV